MPGELERIARLESRMQAAEEGPGSLNDHEERLRKIERVTYGLLITGAVIGWGLTQINNVIKIMGVA